MRTRSQGRAGTIAHDLGTPTLDQDLYNYFRRKHPEVCDP
jgi:hypothetical protein